MSLKEDNAVLSARVEELEAQLESLPTLEASESGVGMQVASIQPNGNVATVMLRGEPSADDEFSCSQMAFQVNHPELHEMFKMGTRVDVTLSIIPDEEAPALSPDEASGD